MRLNYLKLGCCCVCAVCILYITTVLVVAPQLQTGAAREHLPMPFGAFAFEVHGRVQGVFFRKFTVAKAQALHLVGWCANTQRGTVVGECQGAPEALQQMKDWLCMEGSPHSKIQRCEFRAERSLLQLEHDVFERRANVP